MAILPPPVAALCLLAVQLYSVLASTYTDLIQQGQPLTPENFLLLDPPDAGWKKWKHSGDVPAPDPTVTTACECGVSCLSSPECFSYIHDDTAGCQLLPTRGRVESGYNSQLNVGQLRFRAGMARLSDYCRSNSECSFVVEGSWCHEQRCVCQDGLLASEGQCVTAEQLATTTAAATGTATSTTDGQGNTTGTAAPPGGGVAPDPPAGGSTADPPAEGSTADPPAGGVAPDPPAEGSTADPPAGGVAPDPPAEGSTADPPGGPATTDSTNPTTSGNESTSGGESTSVSKSTSGGESTSVSESTSISKSTSASESTSVSESTSDSESTSGDGSTSVSESTSISESTSASESTSVSESTSDSESTSGDGSTSDDESGPAQPAGEKQTVSLISGGNKDPINDWSSACPTDHVVIGAMMMNDGRDSFDNPSKMFCAELKSTVLSPVTSPLTGGGKTIIDLSSNGNMKDCPENAVAIALYSPDGAKFQLGAILCVDVGVSLTDSCNEEDPKLDETAPGPDNACSSNSVVIGAKIKQNNQGWIEKFNCCQLPPSLKIV